MKRWMIALLALLLCAMGAQAEGDFTYYPESEEYVGTWYTEDYILEIDHEDGQEALFSCVVTRYGEDGAGEQWSYGGCAYDDVGKALSSFQVGVMSEIALDDEGEWIPGEPVYEDGAATFALNDDGTLTWTDFNQAPGEDTRVFAKVDADVENPVADYEGQWVCGRGLLTIEDLDDTIYCTVRWGVSAAEEAVWEYEAMLDPVSGALTTLENGVKRVDTYGEDGEVAASEVEFEDGAATFALNEDGTLTWTDYKQTPGEDAFVFERVAE